MVNINKYLQNKAVLIEKALHEALPQENQKPFLLHKAMRYAVLEGGKRLRPTLCLAACEAGESAPETAILPATALELVHTYTLIHDDLPCMDNDDMRRGKPTVHKAFGEAMAVLAGDALQTLAFETLAKYDKRETIPALVKELAEAIGSTGVIGGQVEDIADTPSPSADDIKFIHHNKTARLFIASVKMGGIAAGADSALLNKLGLFGEAYGTAFQIADDLDDLIQDQNKHRPIKGLSCLSVMSEDSARAKALCLLEKASSSISCLQNRGAWAMQSIAELLSKKLKAK